MPTITESTIISGVQIVEPSMIKDERVLILSFAATYDNYVSSINTAISLMNKAQYEHDLEKVDAVELMRQLALITCHYHRIKGMERPENSTVDLIEPDWEMSNNTILCGR